MGLDCTIMVSRGTLIGSCACYGLLLDCNYGVLTMECVGIPNYMAASAGIKQTTRSLAPGPGPGPGQARCSAHAVSQLGTPPILLLSDA